VQPQQTAQRQPWFSGTEQPKKATTTVVKQQAVPKTTKKRSRRAGKSRRLSKKLILIIAVIVIAALGGGVFALRKKPQQTANQTPTTQKSSETTAPKPTGTIRFIATGDNMAFESVNNAAKTAGGYDYLPMMSNFKPLFEKSDIRLCNETTPGGGEALGVTGYPAFNAPTAWSTGFADLGCNLMNLGSDHTNDKGQAGIDAMVSTWESQPGVLAYAGANKSVEEQVKVRYFTVKQVKFAYLSYTTRTVKTDNTIFGINLYNSELASKQIEEARKNATLVIVSITWGNEDQSAITGDQDRIAQELADYGADVVVGGGTHVVQPAKILDGKEGHQTLVWYSLGNFLNSQLPISNLIGGMAIMDFDVATGQLKDPKLLPVYMHYEWTPAQKAAGTVNARTNFKLFPLDQATEALAKSQNGTTVADQTARITSLITQFAPIKVITSTEF
jgi:poly-gamma-glutamate synthesis protein (capsule biosynthesis protein)